MKIAEAVHEHRESQLVDVATVVEKFQALLPTFESGGARRKHYLHAFSGKDLLWAMDDELRALGLLGAMAFQERILLAIAGNTEDVADWLPEWKALRDLVEAVP